MREIASLKYKQKPNSSLKINTQPPTDRKLLFVMKALTWFPLKIMLPEPCPVHKENKHWRQAAP